MRLPVAVVAAAVGAVTAYRRLHPEDDLAGEVAVVTGASRGLGLLLAAELARRGCRLLLCARDQSELERAATRLRATGAQVAALACDVTREESAGRLVDAAVERYGRLDIVINNAGIIRVGPALSANPADYEAALATMTMAPVRLALAALPVMRAQGHGRIVTIASWPRTSPGVRYGPSTPYRCRSEPQIAVDVTRMMMSFGSWIAGSGTSVTSTCSFPCQVSARIGSLSQTVDGDLAGRLMPGTWPGGTGAGLASELVEPGRRGPAQPGQGVEHRQGQGRAKLTAGHGRALAVGGRQHGTLHRVQDRGGHFRHQGRQPADDLGGWGPPW